MEQQELTTGFLMFGTATLLGFLIGLERSMGESENPHATTRDFVIFGLVGATSAFAARHYENAWLVVGGFFGVLTLLISGYWAQHRRNAHADPGVTTEASAIVTFFLGVLIINGATTLAIAVAIVLLIILAEKKVIDRFGTQIQTFELQATLKFLVITFIVLPILPHQSLDHFVTRPIGTVINVEATTRDITFAPARAQTFKKGTRVRVYVEETGELGTFRIVQANADTASAKFEGNDKAFETVTPGTELRMSLVPQLITTMLSAIKPFRVWLIVVLVSFIGFVGYVLIKTLGAGAGIGLTGLIGGLASSTVTTLGFAARSVELPQLNRLFAVAVILASSVMFPRVLLQIGVFNPVLMANIALPMLITGGTGLALAVFLYFRSQGTAVESEEISFDNPFSLKSAVNFGLVFAVILVATRVATTYLGEAWLPVVAVVSGLTDADAIAFSVSDLQRVGLISLDWASFNLVLGSLSNTFMKLFLVLSFACLINLVRAHMVRHVNRWRWSRERIAGHHLVTGTVSTGAGCLAVELAIAIPQSSSMKRKNCFVLRSVSEI